MTDYRHSGWIVVGTSPLARPALARAREWELAEWCDRFPVTITTNGGIRILPVPDIYFAHDFVAIDHYEPEALYAAAHGTRLIGPNLRIPEPIKRALTYGLPPNQKVVNTVRYHLRGAELIDLDEYEPLQLSGMFIVEYAARSGTNEVLLCGMDGYANDGSERYAEGVYGHGQPFGRELTERIIVPRVNTLLRKYPHVQFTCIGRPVYADQIEPADNWRIKWLDDPTPCDPSRS
ncbi:MAG: hypothetical protein DWQ20_00755 [Actinobacteria bacterium]|nr:MAG: hypothetical protein DWQ20_00755 [Actinomycetota bacterium]